MFTISLCDMISIKYTSARKRLMGKNSKTNRVVYNDNIVEKKYSSSNPLCIRCKHANSLQ